MTQPAPKPNDQPAIWDQLIALMRERDQLGRERYQVPLQPFNGRNPFVDLRDEILDALAYCQQAMIEWDAMVAEKNLLKDWMHNLRLRLALCGDRLTQRDLDDLNAMLGNYGCTENSL